MQVWSLGREDPLGEGMADHCSIPAWEIPWTEEPGGLQSMGSQRVGHNWSDLAHTHTLYFSRYCTVRSERFSLFFVFVCMYYLCGKYYKPITVQYYIAHGVSWVRRLTVLDLQMYSLSRAHSYVGDLLYHLLKEFRKTCWASSSFKLTACLQFI